MLNITMIYNEFILKDININSTDKLVYGIIGTLSNKVGYCYASNDYISKQLGLSKRTITKAISNLKKANYIEVKNENYQRHIYQISIDK